MCVIICDTTSIIFIQNINKCFFFIVFDSYFSNLILNDLRFKIQENKIMDLIFVQNTGAAFSLLENYMTFLIVFSNTGFGF